MSIEKDLSYIINPKHGSPSDRGSADFYYYRPPRPHKLVYVAESKHSYKWEEVTELTEEEIAEYMFAYENETDRKDYGEW